MDVDTFFFFGQEQLISTNVLGTELIGRLEELLRKLLDGVQVETDGRRRIMSDLEVLQHPLSQWGHNKTPFVVTTSLSTLPWRFKPPEPSLAGLPAVGFVQSVISEAK